MDRCVRQEPDWQFVRDLIRAHGIRKGKFVLSSGAETSIYIDIRRVVMHSFCGAPLGRLLYNKLRDLPIAAVGGPATAAIPLVSAVLHQYYLQCRSLDGFWVYAKAKGHGTGQWMEGNTPKNKLVALVDDVVTTGSSLRKCVDVVRQRDCQVAKIVSVVSRADAVEKLAETNIPLESLFTLKDLLDD